MRRWPYFVISSLALGSMGSWAFSEARCTRDSAEVAQILSLSHERIHGFAIDTMQETETEFRQRIAQREAEIEAHGGGAKPGLEGGMVGRSYIFGRSRGYLMEGNRRRGEDEIPATSGFCIRRAVIVEPLPSHKNEQLAMHLSTPDHPDLVLTLLRVAGARPGPGLLARSALVDANASVDEMLRVTKLRSEQRNINSLDGEELVERIREFNSTTSHTLSWETRGAERDVLLPFLSLQAQAGTNVRPGSPPPGASSHEDAVLALWDQIATSIRPNSRPTDSRPPVAT